MSLRATVLFAWALALAFTVAVLYAGEAHATSIRTSCDIYATNRVDPIAFSAHLHRQFGNTSLTNASTADSLYASKATSRNAQWGTNAGWVPVERYEAVNKAIVY